MIRQISGYTATFVVGLLLFVFVAYPIGAVLTESFAVETPMSVFDCAR